MREPVTSLRRENSEKKYYEHFKDALKELILKIKENTEASDRWFQFSHHKFHQKHGIQPFNEKMMFNCMLITNKNIISRFADSDGMDAAQRSNQQYEYKYVSEEKKLALGFSATQCKNISEDQLDYISKIFEDQILLGRAIPILLLINSMIRYNIHKGWSEDKSILFTSYSGIPLKIANELFALFEERNFLLRKYNKSEAFVYLSFDGKTPEGNTPKSLLNAGEEIDSKGSIEHHKTHSAPDDYSDMLNDIVLYASQLKTAFATFKEQEEANSKEALTIISKLEKENADKNVSIQEYKKQLERLNAINKKMKYSNIEYQEFINQKLNVMMAQFMSFLEDFIKLKPYEKNNEAVIADTKIKAFNIVQGVVNDILNYRSKSKMPENERQ